MTDRDAHEQESLRRNRNAWNRMAATGHTLAKPVTDDEFRSPLQTVDGGGWLAGGIKGWKVLCLAAGGGRHGPLYASAGGNVTVVDLSSGMLELDRAVARERRCSVRTIETSMDDLQMLTDGEFDLVVHPVSSCYLPRLDRLFGEVARVTREGGMYISQHKQPINLQASLQTFTGRYVVEHAYYNTDPVPQATVASKLREPDTREFAHSWNAILGGICRNGFVIEDVSEPMHARSDALPGEFAHRCYYIAPYIRLKARKRSAGKKEGSRSAVIHLP